MGGMALRLPIISKIKESQDPYLKIPDFLTFRFPKNIEPFKANGLGFHCVENSHLLELLHRLNT